MRAFELEEMKKEGKETQLIFDILANRGHDALSHIGLAREICAVEERKFLTPRPDLGSVPRFGLGKGLKIEIKDKKLCRRYVGAILENIKVVSSPKWMQERLLVCGIKPINNIVDIANYVMLETGQPLHAFDARKTTGNIIVRKAKKGERIKLLDESEKILTKNNLVIADSERPLALAGVMGGLKSGITGETTSIILESANFDPVNIRKTRLEHGLSTESSYRFERDIDPNLAEVGTQRAIELLQKYTGNNVRLAAYTDIYPKKIKPWEIELDTNHVSRLLGENISVKKIKNILRNLGLEMAEKKNNLSVKIPTFRLDLKTQEDLIEEIGRIYGYENISAEAPMVELSSPPVNEQIVFEDKLRDAMTALGFSEMMNYSFYGQSDIEKCGLDIKDHFEVANPMNPDQQFLRTSLIPGILKNVELNLKNFEIFSIFEIGRKYRDEKKNLPVEKTVLAGAFVRASKWDIDTTNPSDTYFELKGKIEALFAKLGFLDLEFKIPNPEKFWHPTRTSSIMVVKKEIGKIGEVDPKVLASYGIKQKISVFGIGVDKLMEISSINKVYKPIGKFPSVRRDISMFIGEKTKYAEIKKKIREAGRKLVRSIELFDIFEKENEKSLAIRLEIGSREKTLTSGEIDGVMKKIVAKLEKDLKVRVRK